MPRQELTKTNEEKMVDLDVTGPAVDVELPAEGAVITEVEGTPQPQIEVQKAPKKELQDYSRNVQHRINKLTARLREAERREQTATDDAQNFQKQT